MISVYDESDGIDCSTKSINGEIDFSGTNTVPANSTPVTPSPTACGAGSA